MKGEWKEACGNIEKTKNSYIILNKGSEGKNYLHIYGKIILK
jgi:hypothetical protein